MRGHQLLTWLAAVCVAWCAVGDEAIWKEYVEWYRRQPIAVSVPQESYLDHLRRDGHSDADVRKRAAVIERLSHERRDELHPHFFDRTYASAPRFNTEPNALLVETVRNLPPGRALDVHMGQGRNSLYLASKGWNVTGFDFSTEGIRAVRAAAKEAGLTLTATIDRHEDFDFGRNQWDLIVMSYTWVPLHGPYIERILESLRPDGLLVFEHLMDLSGSDSAARWLPGPNELLEIFSGLRVLRYEDVRAPADWSWRPERLARLVAEK
jgi:SAM-dependent methyltransferase